VFICYAHTRTTSRQVTRLANELEASGVRVLFDGGTEKGIKGRAPPPNWAQWAESCLDEADWIILVCNEALARCYREYDAIARQPNAPHKNLAYELRRCREIIHSQGPERFIPVSFISKPPLLVHLANANCYVLWTDLDQLRMRILAQEANEPPPPVPRPPLLWRRWIATGTLILATSGLGWWCATRPIGDDPGPKAKPPDAVTGWVTNSPCSLCFNSDELREACGGGNATIGTGHDREAVSGKHSCATPPRNSEFSVFLACDASSSELASESRKWCNENHGTHITLTRNP